MTQASLAASADYSDALVAARNAKNKLFLVLCLILIFELAIFFAARYSEVLITSTGTKPHWAVFLKYIINPLTLLGFGLTVILASVLLLTLLVMVIGRLVGVARITSAYLWCIVLGILMFPWQGFLYFPGIGDSDFRIPGVLYTWGELVKDAKFNITGPHLDASAVALKWARFVAFPFVALLILLVVQARSRRGLRQALGEANPNLPNERLL
jgi:hypothetical protein